MTVANSPTTSTQRRRQKSSPADLNRAAASLPQLSTPVVVETDDHRHFGPLIRSQVSR
jgi:hypothetical protein